MFSKLLHILFLLFTIQVFAQTQDSSDVEKISYAYYPMVFYTPETKFAAGIGGMFYTRLGLEKYLQPSKLTLSAYYTTNHQYSVFAGPTLYFGGSAHIISESEFIYSKEISKFYGIGNNTPEIENSNYEINLFQFYTELGYETSLIKKLHIGLIYEYSTANIKDEYDNPELDESIIGYQGGKTSGLGFLIIVDHRDNIFFPTKNGFFKARFIMMGRDLGSDYSYRRIVLDLRRYHSWGNENVIAAQFFLESTYGDVPFFKLPMLGGSEKMRGYFLGRYRDNQYFTAQIEYRKIVWWRLGIALFAGLGDVSHSLKQFSVSQLKYSYGAGLRFVFDEKEKINVRMDIGFGKNTSGVYFSLEEAF